MRNAEKERTASTEKPRVVLTYSFFFFSPSTFDLATSNLKLCRRFPFPDDPAGFKQKPGGWKTRNLLIEILSHFAVRHDLPVAVMGTADAIAIGNYRVSRSGFHELLDYLWRGGYPRWQNGVRPAYVLRMAQAAEASSSVIFAGVSFTP